MAAGQPNPRHAAKWRSFSDLSLFTWKRRGPAESEGSTRGRSMAIVFLLAEGYGKNAYIARLKTALLSRNAAARCHAGFFVAVPQLCCWPHEYRSWELGWPARGSSGPLELPNFREREARKITEQTSPHRPFTHLSPPIARAIRAEIWLRVCA